MYFFTATINSWKTLLNDDELKRVMIDSMKWMVENKRANIYGFVVMPNHFHILWGPIEPFENHKNESSLIRFTAHEFKKNLDRRNKRDTLSEYFSTQIDRQFHFWERRSRTVEVVNRKIAEQKLDYIHNNPVKEKWKLASLPELYEFSSAAWYFNNDRKFDFISHYMDFI